MRHAELGEQPGADAATAAWCARPIDLGYPGWVLTPLVLSPERVPVVIDTKEAVCEPPLRVPM